MGTVVELRWAVLGILYHASWARLFTCKEIRAEGSCGEGRSPNFTAGRAVDIMVAQCTPSSGW